MKVETLGDVLEWSRELHHQLSACLQACSEKSENARVKLLLEYLARHETTLESVIRRFEETADPGVLSTWCYEYLDCHPITKYKQCDKPFEGMTTLEIMADVIEQHKPVIELYRYLFDKADTPDTRELLEELVQLEEHEVMRMAQGANRLEDY